MGEVRGVGWQGGTYTVWYETTDMCDSAHNRPKAVHMRVPLCKKT